MRANYINSFTFMAKRGFYSFDKSVDEESPYVLVAAPKGINIEISHGKHPIINYYNS